MGSKGGAMATNRAFADPNIAPGNDFRKFSKREISADAKEKAIEQLEPFPPARSTTPMDLAHVIGSEATNKIQKSGKITFHTVGDTGGVYLPQFQVAVANAMASDTSSGASLWYHLGDVVYYFGQEQYYFEQFYNPYRNYNAPIIAIPGNHDGVLFKGEGTKSLEAFVANFCTPTPTQNPDSQGSARTTMDQPGVYFTLNAPFVKFIGLYSNTGEGPTEGVIAAKKIGDAQLTFLQQQLAAAKKERDSGLWRALIIATHHPPFTASPNHVPSPEMLKQIDDACKTAGIQPDMYLSGHAHLYERYMRTVGGKKIVYLVAGMGGYYDLPGLKSNPVPPPKTPASGKDASGNPLTLEVYNDNTFGFLRITVTASGNPPGPGSIAGQFVTVNTTTGKTGLGDSFTLDLKGNKVSSGGSARVATKKGGAAQPGRRV
jgi:Calcineurin-like phosphoesterase